MEPFISHHDAVFEHRLTSPDTDYILRYEDIHLFSFPTPQRDVAAQSVTVWCQRRSMSHLRARLLSEPWRAHTYIQSVHLRNNLSNHYIILMLQWIEELSLCNSPSGRNPGFKKHSCLYQLLYQYSHDISLLTLMTFSTPEEQIM